MGFVLPFLWTCLLIILVFLARRKIMNAVNHRLQESLYQKTRKEMWSAFQVNKGNTKLRQSHLRFLAITCTHQFLSSPLSTIKLNYMQNIWFISLNHGKKVFAIQHRNHTENTWLFSKNTYDSTKIDCSLILIFLSPINHSWPFLLFLIWNKGNSFEDKVPAGISCKNC